VFDAPRTPAGSSEALIVDNLDIGRPHNVEIIFGRRIPPRHPQASSHRDSIAATTGCPGNLFYKHSRIKQYLKDARAMRIETVINTPRDLGCNARLPNLDDLQDKARASTAGSWMLNASPRVCPRRVQPLTDRAPLRR